MKIVWILLISVLLFSTCAMTPVESKRLADANPASTSGRTPVLVELFTAEGCSSCPPAERVLARLQREQPIEKAEIITLALHVDYWDELGWKDKYASPLNTQRQKIYDGKFRTGRIYTPQMVVDGDQEFVGSNFSRARKAIQKAIKKKKGSVVLSSEDDKVTVKISDLPEHENLSIYLSYAEDGIKSSIQRGENAGKDLTHVSVLRRLKAIGRVEANESSKEVTVPLEIASDWNRDNLNVVVFLQENGTRNIYGVGRIGLRNEVKAD